jgi:putative heme-binding domain-containing protein
MTFRSHVIVGFALAAILLPLGHAQATTSSANPEAAKAGEFEFRINCAFCHGLGARGGGRGPDLTGAQKRHGNANGTNGQGVGMTDEEIWQIVAYLRSIQVKAPVKPIGNPVHGKQLFDGDASCSRCHMVEGKGGRLGPDLTGAGTARTTDSLIESVRNPSQKLAWGVTEPTKEFAQEYLTVTVVTPEGKQIKGVTLNEDNFSLQVMDTSQQIHLFEKDKLRSIKKSRESLMPAYDNATLSDQDLHDIVAYLLSVATK